MNALKYLQLRFRPSFRLYLASTSWIVPIKTNNIVHRTQNKKLKIRKLKHRNQNAIAQNTMSHIGFRTKVNSCPTIYYIYLYSWCTIKTTILQSGLFLSDDWYILSLIQPLFPSRPKTPFTHVVYLYNDVQLSKGHLGSRGEHLKTNWKTPVSSFQWQTSQF